MPLLLPLCNLDEQNIVVALLDMIISNIGKQRELLTQAIEKNSLLKQSILKQAFSGCLITQDSSDESASFLLENIKSEKARVMPIQSPGC